MSEPKALPPRPSLEFERKEAKALLRQLCAGDPDALTRARARHPALQGSAPDTIQLADAQLVIAREYGFTSWPRLIRYFDDAERLLHRTPSQVNPALYRAENWPATLSLDLDAQAALEEATHIAAGARRDAVRPRRLLLALVERGKGAIVETIERYGGSVDKVREFLNRLR